jgi:hypothetical protein
MHPFVALGIVGFLVGIPMFLDAAVVMLLPLAVGVSRQTGPSVTAFASPMLAGMAVTHTFVPPTPGPIAVAQFLHADLGWFIVIGALAGLLTLLMTGPFASTVLARSASGRPSTTSAMPASGPQRRLREPSVELVAGLLILPLVLIVGVTVARAGRFFGPNSRGNAQKLDCRSHHDQRDWSRLDSHAGVDVAFLGRNRRKAATGGCVDRLWGAAVFWQRLAVTERSTGPKGGLLMRGHARAASRGGMPTKFWFRRKTEGLVDNRMPGSYPSRFLAVRPMIPHHVRLPVGQSMMSLRCRLGLR